MNSLSWKTPTSPLPAETNPRFVFERMFGIGTTAEERLARVQEDRSILDRLSQQIAKLNGRLGARDRTKLGEYFDAVRDIEQRIAKAESYNSDFSVPEQPVGVPPTFREYVELMFDCRCWRSRPHHARQRVHDVRENINRRIRRSACPRASFDVASRQQSGEDAELREVTTTTSTRDLLLKKLAAVPDGDGNLLDPRLLYGGGMSDGNVHNNYSVPVVMGAEKPATEGNRHVTVPEGHAAGHLMLGVRPVGVQAEIRRQHV